jgi:hypothetical protein
MNSQTYSEKQSIFPCVGFSVAQNATEEDQLRLQVIHREILKQFPWLTIEFHIYGEFFLTAWGFNSSSSYFVTDENERYLYLLSGTPFGDLSLASIKNDIAGLGKIDCLEGRWNFLRVNETTNRVDIWNDWVGSSPVFLYYGSSRTFISTLEAVIVKFMDLSSDDFSKRGIVELLSYGQFIGQDTLFENINTKHPDSYSWWNQDGSSGSRWLESIPPQDEINGHDIPLLIEKMKVLSEQAISESLINATDPISLPLSSGMDSRLLACILTDQKQVVEAFSYGPKEWTEVANAKKVADALAIKWNHVNLDENYYADYVQKWLTWFGSSLHAHGMYQYPFLNLIQKGSIIPNGFLGNNMAGGDHPNDCLFQTSKSLQERFSSYGVFWDKKSLRKLLDFNPDDFLDEINEIFNSQYSKVSEWPEYQQMNAIDMWNRQSRFVFYQTQMYNYYGKERSPFMWKTYAKFCMGLPSHLLKKRYLQVLMLNKYWPKVAQIDSTFVPLTGIKRKWQGARSIVAHRMPKSLRPFMGKTPVNLMEADCMKKRKWENLYPLATEKLKDIPWLNLLEINKTAKKSIHGDPLNTTRMRAIQPILYRILNNE